MEGKNNVPDGAGGVFVGALELRSSMPDVMTSGL